MSDHPAVSGLAVQPNQLAAGRRRAVRPASVLRADTCRALVPSWAAIPLAVVGGLVLDASFPSLGWWPLAFVAVALGLVAHVGRSLLGSFAVGAAFGAAFFYPHVSWAAAFLGDHPWSWVPWIALASAQTVMMAALSPLITLAYRWLPRWRGSLVTRLVLLPALVAGVWMSRELMLGSWPYGGFPWGRLGMSQSESLIAPVASWVGVTGLGFLMVALCATTVEATRYAWRSPSRWAAFAPGAVLMILLVITPQFTTTPAGSIRVGAVQGNGPAAYADQHAPGAVLASQLVASAPLESNQVDLVLWPEGGVDSDPNVDPQTAQTLSEAASRYDAPILMNAASAQRDAVYNTSFLWTQDGPTASHSKRNPVPFGEYVPHRSFYSTIAPSLIELLEREYTAGIDSPVIPVADASVGLAICFDVAFDEVIWEGAHDGAQVYMFQTNNADFRSTDENLQQLAFARMRAIETGRSVINLSTTGTSQVFAPDGTTLDSLPVDEPGLMIAEVELRDGITAAVALAPSIKGSIVAGTLLALALLAGSTLRSAGVGAGRSAPSLRRGRR
ncbi:apolipoprotein N-acyltransferase [Ornithinimicrobium sp. Y1847]|uniref:apolipoprotein N-acyltransferase n=1 Tax=Ornithinimicrobium sp. Y1847 TaxID=3405419 RepID=UPI003B67AE46